MSRRYWKTAAFLALAAAGCATESAEQPCPSALIVARAGEVTQFLPGPGRDLTDVVMEAEIRDLDGFCDFDLERDGTGEVTVDMTVLFEAERGPANETRSGQFSYFIALVDQNQNILKKPVFDSDVEFPTNTNRVQFSETIGVDIPLRAGETSTDYSILVGFQLTEEEVTYNLSKSQ